MPAPLIGLIGRARAGKDTFADHLVMAHGFTKASFAAPLKAAALRLDPLIPVLPAALGSQRPNGIFPQPIQLVVQRLSEVVRVHGWEEAKDKFPEVRAILQRLGTDAIRKIDDGFWVRQAVAGLDPDTPTVFTDVRFPNEADMLRSRGGVLIRIVRPGVMIAGSTHASETALDQYPVDMTVDNTGTHGDLIAKARDVALALLP
jgi:hypothetical protein